MTHDPGTVCPNKEIGVRGMRKICGPGLCEGCGCEDGGTAEQESHPANLNVSITHPGDVREFWRVDWLDCDGQHGFAVLPNESEAEEYAAGILAKITLPDDFTPLDATTPVPAWAVTLQHKLDTALAKLDAIRAAQPIHEGE